MFAAVDEAVGAALAVRREGRRRELVSLFAEQARLAQRVTQLVREADDDADWRAAGCSSSAQWLAQLSSSDHRTAVRITQTSAALAESAGARPRAEHGRVDARPGRRRRRVRDTRERCRARACRGRQAAERDRAGRAHARAARGRRRRGAVRAARAEHDVDARSARAVSERPAAARAGRRSSSRRSGTSPSSSAPPTSRPAASSTGSSRPPTRSSHSPNTRGGERGGVRRSPTTLIVHLSDDAPPMLEGAGPLSPETAERLACDARRLTIKLERPRPRALARRALRVLRAAARAAQALRPLPVPRLHRHPRARGTPPRRRRARRHGPSSST